MLQFQNMRQCKVRSIYIYYTASRLLLVTVATHSRTSTQSISGTLIFISEIQKHRRSLLQNIKGPAVGGAPWAGYTSSSDPKFSRCPPKNNVSSRRNTVIIRGRKSCFPASNRRSGKSPSSTGHPKNVRFNRQRSTGGIWGSYSLSLGLRLLEGPNGGR